MLQSEKILEELSSSGFSIVSDFLAPGFVERLCEDLNQLRSNNAFHEARVGQGAKSSLEQSIRRDSISWFEPQSLSQVQKELWEHLERLKRQMNVGLFLGLWDFEGHYAIYQPGGFYDRHLDRFKTDDLRKVSVVLYLNSDWTDADGGELALFLDSAAEPLLIQPRSGTAVFFLSDRIEHQVRATSRERLSFAGWFRTRSPGLNRTLSSDFQG